VTAPPIAPRLEAGVSEFGGVAVWMHDKQHIRSDLKKRKKERCIVDYARFETRWQGWLSEPSGGGEPPLSPDDLSDRYDQGASPMDHRH